MVTAFPSTSYTYFQVSLARIQYLLNLPAQRPARGRRTTDIATDFIDKELKVLLGPRWGSC
jgi:hypothetical protein